jgi:fructose-specific component phosphotransferase system IIB-like protein
MAFENLFAGAKDMLAKAKDLVEETTGVDIDAIEEKLAHPGDLLAQAKEAVSHPDQLLAQAKAKGSELFEKAKAPFTGDNTEETTADADSKSEVVNPVKA